MVQAPAVGNEGGVPFQYYLPTPMVTLKKIIVMSDWKINMLQVLVTDGVKNVFSPAYGLPTSNYFEW